MDMLLIVAFAPFVALFVIFAAIGLAWITHGDAGAEEMTQQLLVGPFHRAVEWVHRL